MSSLHLRWLDGSDKGDAKLWQEVMGWIGTVLCIFFFISPVTMVIQLVKKQITYKDINILIFICNFLNCCIWTAYGIRQEKPQMYACNGIGTFFTALFTCFYWVYFAELKPLPSIIYLVLYLDIGLEIFWIFYDMIKNVEVVKYIVLVINIIMYFMPGLKMFEVIKTKNRDLIPVYMSFLSIVACVCWLTYGLGINDLSVIVPNALGIVFSIMQITVWSWAKCKYPNGDPNVKKEVEAASSKEKSDSKKEVQPPCVKEAKRKGSEGDSLVIKVGSNKVEEPKKEVIDIENRGQAESQAKKE